MNIKGLIINLMSSKSITHNLAEMEKDKSTKEMYQKGLSIFPVIGEIDDWINFLEQNDFLSNRRARVKGAWMIRDMYIDTYRELLVKCRDTDDELSEDTINRLVMGNIIKYIEEVYPNRKDYNSATFSEMISLSKTIMSVFKLDAQEYAFSR